MKKKRITLQKRRKKLSKNKHPEKTPKGVPGDPENHLFWALEPLFRTQKGPRRSGQRGRNRKNEENEEIQKIIKKRLTNRFSEGPQERVGGMSPLLLGGWYFNDSFAPMLLNVWREHIFEKSGAAAAVRKGEYKGVGPFCFGHVHGSRQKAVS